MWLPSGNQPKCENSVVRKNRDFLVTCCKCFDSNVTFVPCFFSFIVVTFRVLDDVQCRKPCLKLKQSVLHCKTVDREDKFFLGHCLGLKVQIDKKILTFCGQPERSPAQSLPPSMTLLCQQQFPRGCLMSNLQYRNGIIFQNERWFDEKRKWTILFQTSDIYVKQNRTVFLK